MRLGGACGIAIGALGAVFACSTFSSSPDAPDAGPDAPAPQPPAPPPLDAAKFCTNADASLCWSFDEDSYLGPFVPSLDGGTVGATDAAPHSPPAALEVAIAPIDAGPEASVSAGVVWTPPRAIPAHCELQMKVTHIGPSGVSVIGVGFGNYDLLIVSLSRKSDTAVAVSFTVENVVFPIPATRTDFAPMTLGAWSRITLDADPDGGAVTVDVDGQSATVPNTQGPHVMSYASLGALSPASDAPWTVDFDDVLCR